MDQPPSIVKPLFRFLTAAAVPGTLWAGIELYVLTLRGAQMLFFSIAHTMAPLLLVVLLSAIALAGWIAFSFGALLVPNLRNILAIPRRAHVMVVVAGLVHLSLFYWYENWSGLEALRIAICLAGIATLSLLFWLAIAEWRLTAPPRGAVHP